MTNDWMPGGGLGWLLLPCSGLMLLCLRTPQAASMQKRWQLMITLTCLMMMCCQENSCAHSLQAG